MTMAVAVAVAMAVAETEAATGHTRDRPIGNRADSEAAVKADIYSVSPTD